MRDPLRSVLIHFSLLILGAGTAWLALGPSNQTTAVVIVGIVGVSVAFSAFFAGVVALFSIRGYNRLKAGQGMIARWHVTAAEWDRFHTLDKSRAAQARNLRNDLSIRWRTPPQGVDIVVGPDQILVDGSYHPIAHFVPDGRIVNWLAGDPDCLEFPISYPPGRYITYDYTLRIPVPAASRADGLRVLEHYKKAST